MHKVFFSNLVASMNNGCDRILAGDVIASLIQPLLQFESSAGIATILPENMNDHALICMHYYDRFFGEVQMLNNSQIYSLQQYVLNGGSLFLTLNKDFQENINELLAPFKIRYKKDILLNNDIKHQCILN